MVGYGRPTQTERALGNFDEHQFGVFLRYSRASWETTRINREDSRTLSDYNISKESEVLLSTAHVKSGSASQYKCTGKACWRRESPEAFDYHHLGETFCGNTVNCRIQWS